MFSLERSCKHHSQICTISLIETNKPIRICLIHLNLYKYLLHTVPDNIAVIVKAAPHYSLSQNPYHHPTKPEEKRSSAAQQLTLKSKLSFREKSRNMSPINMSPHCIRLSWQINRFISRVRDNAVRDSRMTTHNKVKQYRNTTSGTNAKVIIETMNTE